MTTPSVFICWLQTGFYLKEVFFCCPLLSCGCSKHRYIYLNLVTKVANYHIWGMRSRRRIRWNGNATCNFSNTCDMTTIGQHLSSLVMSEIAWPHWLWDAVSHTIQRLHIWAAQVDMDLVILCGDDAGISVCALGFMVWALARRSLIGTICWLWRTGPDSYNLNGAIVVVRCHTAWRIWT